MPIPIICPCSAKLRVNDRLAGLQVQCPKCGAVHPVAGTNGTPAAARPEVPPPAPAPRPAAAPPSADTAAALSQSDLTEADRALLAQQLEDGEGVVWAGKPCARTAFLAGLVGTGFFGVTGLVLFIALVILLAMGAVGAVGGIILGLVVLAFAGAAAGWPFWARHRARRTYYAITTRRALGQECDLLGRSRLEVYEPHVAAAVKPMIYSQAPDATGHLIFRSGYVSERILGYKMRYFRHWGFFNVPRAKEVLRLLHETLIDPYLEQTYDRKEGD